MYRIRFHGRGGQGIKTGGRILGTALFLEGLEVQDAPRYGAERRGAPIFAYVRADTHPIQERGVIHRPDLVVVADETLLTIAASQVLEGVTPASVILIHSDRNEAWWRQKLNGVEQIVVLPGLETVAAIPAGALCAGAAAALLGIVEARNLARAVDEELSGLDPELLENNRQAVLGAFMTVTPWRGQVRAGPPLSVADTPPPVWVDMPCDPVDVGAPVIHAGSTSRLVRTGLWRTRRPVIDADRCRRCGQCCIWCPEGGISTEENGLPVIDYEHCKGCLICAARCPFDAIRVIPEAKAREERDA